MPYYNDRTAIRHGGACAAAWRDLSHAGGNMDLAAASAVRPLMAAAGRRLRAAVEAWDAARAQCAGCAADKRREARDDAYRALLERRAASGSDAELDEWRRAADAAASQ